MGMGGISISGLRRSGWRRNGCGDGISSSSSFSSTPPSRSANSLCECFLDGNLLRGEVC